MKEAVKVVIFYNDGTSKTTSDPKFVQVYEEVRQDLEREQKDYSLVDDQFQHEPLTEEKEEFRLYEKCCWVSQFGQVMNLAFTKLINPYRNGNRLTFLVGTTTYTLSRAVATCWLKPVEEATYIGYKDNDRMNCQVKNIYWKTKLVRKNPDRKYNVFALAKHPNKEIVQYKVNYVNQVKTLTKMFSWGNDLSVHVEGKKLVCPFTTTRYNWELVKSHINHPDAYPFVNDTVFKIEDRINNG